jgi:LPS export ABC transporter protein LptC
MNWRWIITVALLAALLAGYSAFLRRDPAGAINNTLEQPGYYLEDAVVTQSNEDGSPGITFIAKRVEQPQREEQINLIDVEVDYLQTPEQRWSLKAKRAVVPRDSRIVQFSGDVELRLVSSAEKTYLKTQALTLDTAKNLAYSNGSPVDVQLGPYLVTAQRIDVDLRREKVRLRGVNGRSVPQQAPKQDKSDRRRE